MTPCPLQRSSPTALVIYGSPRSRTMRTLWMAAELGLAFEHRPVEWSDPALKAPGFTALNPAGTIPTIVDDGFALSESMAINLYLAKKHSRGETGLYPDSPEAEAEVWRWSLWAQGQLEPWVKRDARTAPLREAAGAQLVGLITASLDVLDRALADRAWLVGGAFTVADLNVAGVLSPHGRRRSTCAATRASRTGCGAAMTGRRRRRSGRGSRDGGGRSSGAPTRRLAQG